MMKVIRFLQKRYKVLAVVFLTIGILLAGGMVYKAYGNGETDYSAIEDEVESFADSIINILTGPFGKALCIASIIAGVFCLLSHKYGAAIGCIIAAILLGAAKPLAEAIMGK